MSNFVKKIFYFLLIVILVTVAIIYIPKIELNPPQITFSRDINYIGVAPIDVFFTDEGEGLKRVSVSLIDNKQKRVLDERSYKKRVSEAVITIKLDPKEMDITDGTAQLVIEAEDHSKVKLISGNKIKIEKDITIDLEPPKIKELSSTQTLKHGGSGFIIYKATEDTVNSGIKIKDYYFRGYSGYFKEKDIFICVFAYPYNLDDKEKIIMFAEDRAGNETVLPIYYYINKTNYRERYIEVGEEFITTKMMPLVSNEKLSGLELKDIFLIVNNQLRTENNNKISEISSKSVDKKLWNGKFEQLTRSLVEANFADKRNYKFNGEVIDKQYHLGYDLSVTKEYPVEASNSGVVVYADHLGIYGNTVIIDHGIGIMSLYSHLSSITVKEGDKLNKKDIIGNTGITGLASGDHLHFGIYIHGQPVRPLEWWDPVWIKNNFDAKINDVKQKYGLQ